MKSTPAIALLACVIAGFASAASPESAPIGVISLGRAKVAAGGALVENSLYKIQMAKRAVPGAYVEIHTHDTDIFYILDGSGTFVTGGVAVGKQEVAPGEIHAKSMTGGTKHHLGKGDVIVIPHGIPHQFTQIEQAPLLYFVVKVVQ